MRSIDKGEWQEIQPTKHVERLRFFINLTSLQVVAVRKPLLVRMSSYFLLEGVTRLRLNIHQRNLVGDHLVAVAGCHIPATLTQLDLSPAATAHVKTDIRTIQEQHAPLKLSPVAFVQLMRDERELFDASRL